MCRRLDPPSSITQATVPAFTKLSCWLALADSRTQPDAGCAERAVSTLSTTPLASGSTSVVQCLTLQSPSHLVTSGPKSILLQLQLLKKVIHSAYSLMATFPISATTASGSQAPAVVGTTNIPATGGISTTSNSKKLEQNQIIYIAGTTFFSIVSDFCPNSLWGGSDYWISDSGGGLLSIQKSATSLSLLSQPSQTK